MVDRKLLTIYHGSKKKSYFQVTKMKKDKILTKIYQIPKSVFTNKDLALLWRESDVDRLKSKIFYYVKRGDLIKISRGIFASKPDYKVEELALSLYHPAYISFETSLRQAGLIFQHYNCIFVASTRTLTRTIDGHCLCFRKLKDSLLFNPMGIENRNNISIATVERAFLDTLYLFPNYYFDNLNLINWDKCEELVGIYDNQALVKRLAAYRKKYA